MTHAEAIHILELLMEGIHPATGEILTGDIFSEPDVIFSIRMAIRALRLEEREYKIEHENKDDLGRYITKRNRLNAGRPWTPKDDQKLTELFQQQATVDEMCVALQRRHRGLTNRLEYLGLIPTEMTISSDISTERE